MKRRWNIIPPVSAPDCTDDPEPAVPDRKPTRDSPVDHDRTSRLTRKAFEKVVEKTLADLPVEIENVIVLVEERDPDGGGLLGLYEGIPLPARGMDYVGVLPDRIVLYMDTHLALGLNRCDLIEEIRATVLHEIGHHLGLDNQRLDQLGWA